jgi:nickel superoxide dismutase
MRYVGIAILLTLLLVPALVSAHCEVPCGIYDDEARVAMLAEHATTIAKAMEQIEALTSSAELNSNQIVRWINTKEQHATEVQQIVSQYFMTQRIKPDQEDYAEKLQSLHRMLLSAMKCKQTTDLANVEALRSELDTFHDLYFGEH